MTTRIRVLRLLEYSYDSVETMQADMARWGVQGQKKDGHDDKVWIKSVTLPLEVLTGPEGPETPEAPTVTVSRLALIHLMGPKRGTACDETLELSTSTCDLNRVTCPTCLTLLRGKP